ncbi:MAG: DEAD/DEAH box helicase [Deltaproteobacteria bacterium]
MGKRPKQPVRQRFEVWGEGELPALHPYQRAAVTELERWAEDPTRERGTLCMPTGSGKTRTAVYFALDRWVRHGRRVLWLCHRTELLEQAVDGFRKLKRAAGRSFTVGRYGSKGEGRIDEPVDVVVAKVPSLTRVGGQEVGRIAALWEQQGGFSLVVVDEAHHAVAATWRKLLERAKRLDPAVRILGLTATPTRAVETERGALVREVGAIIHELRAGVLIDGAYLARPTIHYVDTQQSFEASADEVAELERFGDLAKSLVNWIANDAARNARAAKAFEDGPFGQGATKWGRTLVFAQNKVQAKALRDAIDARCDLNVQMVFGDTAPDERRRLVEAFSGLAGRVDVQVLVNVGVFTEGTDLTGVETVLVARPTRSPVLFAQMIGRGMRGPENGGTAGCHIIVLQDEIKVGDVLATSYGWEQEQLAAMELEQAATALEQICPLPETTPVPQEPEPHLDDGSEAALLKRWLDAGLVSSTTTSARILGRWVIEDGEASAELPIFEGEVWLDGAVRRVREARTGGGNEAGSLRALGSVRELVHVTPGCLEHFVAVLGRTVRAPEFVPCVEAIEGAAEAERNAEVVEAADAPIEAAEPITVEVPAEASRSAATGAEDGTSEQVQRLVGLWKRAGMVEATARASKLAGVWVAPADEAAFFPIFEGEKPSVVGDLEDVRRIRTQGLHDQSTISFFKGRTPTFVTRACRDWFVRALRSTRNIPAFLGGKKLDAFAGSAHAQRLPQLVEDTERPPASPVSVNTEVPAASPSSVAMEVTEPGDGTTEHVRTLVSILKRAGVVDATAQARHLLGLWVVQSADHAAYFPVFEGENSSVVNLLENVRRIRAGGGYDQAALDILAPKTPGIVTRAGLRWFVRALRSTRNIPALLRREILDLGAVTGVTEADIQLRMSFVPPDPVTAPIDREPPKPVAPVASAASVDTSPRAHERAPSRRARLVEEELCKHDGCVNRRKPGNYGYCGVHRRDGVRRGSR